MTTSVLPAAPELAFRARPLRRAPWRSPTDQPRYARPALLALTLLAGLLYFWGISRSSYHTFYADAVRSMTESWKAFAFGSYDPAGTITLDKLPGFLWPQALSARLFGFHPWALTLPQAVEGVLCVLVLYRVVRRWAGADAALLAAAAFALTPALAGLFRTAVEDPLFTLLLLLAADATQRAAQQARLRSLLLAAVWVGLAFQAKMLESWAVLPALGLVHLVSAPAPLRRRLTHLGLAGLVTVAVSASWVLMATLVPAADRPYIDGTTDNSAYSMVVGYNFLNRFTSVGLTAEETGSVTSGRGGPMGSMWSHGAAGTPPGQAGTARSGTDQTDRTGTGQSDRTRAGTGAAQPATTPAGSTPSGSAQSGTAQPGAARAGHGGQGGGDGGWTKMFGSQFASQTGWLYPIAAVSVLCALLWRRREPRTDHLRAGFLLWGSWLAVFFLVFSAGSVGGHSYYMGVIATPLAALFGGGTVLLWRGFRTGGARAWALPVAVTGTAVWAAYLTHLFPAFLPWLAPATLLLGVLAPALLLLGRTPRLAGRRLPALGLLTGLAAMLLAPAAWAASVLDPAYGNSGMGTVGPQAAHAFGGTRGQHGSGRNAPQQGPPGAFAEGGAKLTEAQQAVLDYTEAHADGARYLFATPNWTASSPYILATGKEVLPMGGFTGQVPNPTLSRFQSLVTSGQLHYVLVATGGRTSATAPTTAITDWVRRSCTEVPPSAYGRPGGAADRDQLYRCGSSSRSSAASANS